MLNEKKSIANRLAVAGGKVGKVWIWGGNSNNGSSCGLGCSNSNNAWSNSNSNISARITTFGSATTLSTLRPQVARHAKAVAHLEPRRRAYAYSTCGRNNNLVGGWHPCPVHALVGLGNAHSRKFQVKVARLTA